MGSFVEWQELGRFRPKYSARMACVFLHHLGALSLWRLFRIVGWARGRARLNAVPFWRLAEKEGARPPVRPLRWKFEFCFGFRDLAQVPVGDTVSPLSP